MAFGVLYKPHSSKPYCSGKLNMCFRMPSERIVSFCARILWVFQTNSLKTSRSFCISGIMMNARSILYDWTVTQQNKHVAGLQHRLFYVKLTKRTLTYPNHSFHMNGFLCLETKPWPFRDKPNLHVLELAFLLLLLFSVHS